MIETFNPSSVAQMHNMSIVESCINISITDDTTGEPDEWFTVRVEGVDPSGRLTIVNGTITIIIRDNECKLNCVSLLLLAFLVYTSIQYK